MKRRRPPADAARVAVANGAALAADGFATRCFHNSGDDQIRTASGTTRINVPRTGRLFQSAHPLKLRPTRSFDVPVVITKLASRKAA